MANNKHDTELANPLNEKYATFVEEYLQHGNAARAARAAGYPDKTARSAGSYLLTVPDIRATLEAAHLDQAKRFKATKARVVREIARLAFTSRHDYTRTANLKMLGDYLGIFDGEGSADTGTGEADAERVLSSLRKSGQGA